MRIKPGRYLAEVASHRVKRGSDQRVFVLAKVLILRELHVPPFEPGVTRSWVLGSQPGDLVECIHSSKSRSYNDDVIEMARAAGVALPKLPADLSDAELEAALAPCRGKRVVIQGEALNLGHGARYGNPFVATHWREPTPLDGFQDCTREEALALLGRVYRTLKDDASRRPGDRIDDVLRLLESLEVPR